jgi:hypothetical protein
VRPLRSPFPVRRAEEANRLQRKLRGAAEGALRASFHRLLTVRRSTRMAPRNHFAAQSLSPAFPGKGHDKDSFSEL